MSEWEVRGWAREMCVGMLTGLGKLHTDEAYQETLASMAHRAQEEMKWPVEEERDLKSVCRFMKLLIAARQENNEAMMVEVRRKRFQMRAAKECLGHLRFTNGVFRAERACEGVSGRDGKKRRDTDDARARRHGRETS